MHYKVNKKTSAEIIKINDDAMKERKEWQKYAVSIGAKGFFLGRSWFAVCVAGFEFDGDPPKEYYRHKKNWNVCVPRAGTEMRKHMEKMTQEPTTAACKLIGFEQWGGDGNIYTPSIKIKDGYAYVDVHDEAAPPKKNVTRISDLAYEKLFPRKKTKK